MSTLGADLSIGLNPANYNDASLSSAAKLTIANSGNIGIGTTSPRALLHVNGSGAANAIITGSTQSYLRFSNATGMNTTGFAIGRSLNGDDANDFFIYDTTNSATRLAITNAGNVGIGTTSPWRTLSVTGTVGFSSSLSAESGSDNYLCIDPTSFEITNGGANCAASSLRYKENMQDLSYGLDDVLVMRPVSFQWTMAERPDDRSTQVGFIAEEMNLVVPEVIEYDASGAPESIDYDKLTSILARAIQQIATITGTFKVNLIAWLADASNGITSLFAEIGNFGRVNTDELCVTDGASDNAPVCLTKSQLNALLSQPAAAAIANPSPPSDEPVHESATSTDPIVHESANSEEPTSEPDDTSATTDQPTEPSLSEPANDNPLPRTEATGS